MKLYVFGNGNLGFDAFISWYRAPLMALDLDAAQILVCDFRGVDTLVMELLKDRSAQVSVFHIGGQPRYLPDRYKTKVSSWELIGGFTSDAERDGAAMAACTHFLAVDFNTNAKRTSGTTTNIERGLSLGKLRVEPAQTSDGAGC